jgi:HEAT repeat protein
MQLSAFYLEDGTGRIRVDPRKAQIRPGWHANFWEAAYQSWVLLTRRVTRSGGTETRTLLPGDPVYVIGTVEVNEEAPPDATDAARLVVRPSSRRVPAGWLRRLLSGVKEAPPQDIHDVFLVADTAEVNVPWVILKGAWQVALYTVVYLVSCGWLVWERGPLLSYENWSADLVARNAPPERRLALLRPWVSNPDAAVRRETARALRHVPEADRGEALFLLLTLLGDPEPSVRGAVDAQETDFKPPSGTPAHVRRVVVLSENSDPRVRKSVASMIGWLERPGEEGIGALARLLEDPEPEVRREAVYALKGHGGKASAAAPALVRALRDPYEKESGSSISTTAYHALWHMTPEPAAVLPELREIVRDGSPAERRRAVDLLRRLGPGAAGAEPELLPLLDDPDDGLRREAALTLWRLGRREGPVRSLLIGMLGAAGSGAKRGALDALSGDAASDAAVHSAVRGLLTDADDAVRREAVERIAAWGATAEDVPALISLIRRPIAEKPSVYGPDSSEARVKAIEVLGGLGPAAREAVPALVERLADNGCFSRFREASVEALGRVGPAAGDALPALRDVYRRLRTCCKGNDAQLHIQRSAVGRAVARITLPPRPEGLPHSSDAPPRVRLRFDGSLEGEGAPAATILGDAPPAFVDGVRGQAAAFDGRQAVTFTLNGPLPVGKTFTFELWFRAAPSPPDAGEKYSCIVDIGLLSIEAGGKGELWVAQREGERLWSTHNAMHDKGRIEPDRWHHFAIVHDGYGGAVQEYMDGVQIHRDDDHWLENWQTGDDLELRRLGGAVEAVQFGMRWRGPPSFAGAVDEFALYDYVRTPEQIAGAARR